MQRQKGFTLLELLVVIAIIGILATIVLVAISIARQRGQVAAGQQFSQSLYHGFGANASLVYNFDEQASGANVEDASGHGNVGVLTGASRSTDTPGGTGKSLSLLGNQYVYTAPTGYIPLSTAFTIGAWIQPAVSDSNYRMIISGLSGGAHNFSLYLNQTTHALALYTTLQYSSSYVPQVGVWTYVAVTYANGKATFYANGKEVGVVTGVTPPDDATDEIYVGAFSDIATIYDFQGKLDDVAIFSQALTATMVQNLYVASSQRNDSKFASLSSFVQKLY